MTSKRALFPSSLHSLYRFLSHPLGMCALNKKHEKLWKIGWLCCTSFIHAHTNYRATATTHSSQFVSRPAHDVLINNSGDGHLENVPFQFQLLISSMCPSIQFAINCEFSLISGWCAPHYELFISSWRLWIESNSPLNSLLMQFRLFFYLSR